MHKHYSYGVVNIEVRMFPSEGLPELDLRCSVLWRDSWSCCRGERFSQARGLEGGLPAQSNTTSDVTSALRHQYSWRSANICNRKQEFRNTLAHKWLFGCKHLSRLRGSRLWLVSFASGMGQPTGCQPYDSRHICSRHGFVSRETFLSVWVQRFPFTNNLKCCQPSATSAL